MAFFIKLIVYFSLIRYDYAIYINEVLCLVYKLSLNYEGRCLQLLMDLLDVK